MTDQTDDAEREILIKKIKPPPPAAHGGAWKVAYADFVTAMITSVKVVLANPAAMVVWCATIAVLVGLSLLSGLVGLLVVLPVLGHASWHVYRRAIGPAHAAARD